MNSVKHQLRGGHPMRKLYVLLIVVLAVVVLSACKASEAKCEEYLMSFDFEAFEKGKCERFLED